LYYREALGIMTLEKKKGCQGTSFKAKTLALRTVLCYTGENEFFSRSKEREKEEAGELK